MKTEQIAVAEAWSILYTIHQLNIETASWLAEVNNRAKYNLKGIRTSLFKFNTSLENLFWQVRVYVTKQKNKKKMEKIKTIIKEGELKDLETAFAELQEIITDEGITEIMKRTIKERI